MSSMVLRGSGLNLGQPRGFGLATPQPVSEPNAAPKATRSAVCRLEVKDENLRLEGQITFTSATMRKWLINTMPNPWVAIEVKIGKPWLIPSRFWPSSVCRVNMPRIMEQLVFAMELSSYGDEDKIALAMDAVHSLVLDGIGEVVLLGSIKRMSKSKKR